MTTDVVATTGVAFHDVEMTFPDGTRAVERASFAVDPG